MRAIKKVAIILISLVLAISMITIAYAKRTDDGTGANGTGGGNINTPSTEEDVGVIHAFHVNQGFRVYIVNESGLNVSNVVDFVKYRPWELAALFNSDTYEVVQKMWNDWYNVTGIHNIPKTTIDYLSGAKTDSAYFSQMGQLNKDNSIPTKGGVHYLTREKREDSLDIDIDIPNLWVSPGKMYTIAELELGLRNEITAEYGNWEITGTKKPITYKHKVTGEILQTFNQILAPIEEDIDREKGIMGTGEYMKNLMIMTLSDDYETDDTTVLQCLISMSMPAKNNLGIPTGEGLQPLFFFTDSKIEKKYIEILDKAETEEDKKYAIIDTMRELKLKVAFEPVSWAVPEMTTSTSLPSLVGNKWNYIWTANTIVYGTPTDVMWDCLREFNKEYTKKHPESGIPAYEKYADYLEWTADNDVHVDWQWGLTAYAYKTVRDIPEYNMKAYDEEQISPANAYKLGDTKDRIGYGVMYFSIDLEAVARTSTYDKGVYPENNYSPGKAPEPPVTEEEEEYKKVGKDHKFNIIKFYGEKQPDNNIIYTENHVRENTVHNISIDDEIDYKVNGWFTSPEYREPVSDDESYDDYKLTLQKGLNEGDKEGQVLIPADSTDTTLYVKLVKEKTEEVEGDVAGKIILHEDELAYPYSMEDFK